MWPLVLNASKTFCPDILVFIIFNTVLFDVDVCRVINDFNFFNVMRKKHVLDKGFLRGFSFTSAPLEQLSNNEANNDNPVNPVKIKIELRSFG